MVIQLQRLTSKKNCYILYQDSTCSVSKNGIIHLQQRKVISLHVEYVTFKYIIQVRPNR